MKGKNIMKKKTRSLLIAILTLCMVMGATCTTARASTKVYFGSNQVTVDTFNGVPAYYKSGRK